MPMPNWVRVARLKAEAEKTRAAQQADTAGARYRDHPDPAPAGVPDVAEPAPQERQVDGAGPAARPDRQARTTPRAVGQQGQQQRNVAHWASPGGSARPVAQGDPGRCDAPPARGGEDPRSVPNPRAEAAVERLKKKLDQKAAQRTEEEQAEIDQARRTVRQPDPEIDPEVGADLEAAGELEKPVRDQKGLFVEGNPGGPGRPPGSKNAFPRGTKQILNGLLTGELQDGDSGETAGLKIAQLIMDGLDGKVYLERIAPDGSITKISVSPTLFARMLLDRLEHQEALEAATAKEKGTGGGGIRIVLPNPVVDPLLRPGQKPRGLRLLGQDPSKPLPDTTGTATEKSASAGQVQAQPLAPSPKAKFDPTELIEDFEHPVCWNCLGATMVRDENGIRMIQCEVCEGAGRAPQREELG